MALNWDRIAGWLADPGATAAPGQPVRRPWRSDRARPPELRLTADRSSDANLAPEATFIAATFGCGAACGRAPPALVRGVDAVTCQADLRRQTQRLVSELSGGLDSAIVAGALASTCLPERPGRLPGSTASGTVRKATNGALRARCDATARGGVARRSPSRRIRLDRSWRFAELVGGLRPASRRRTRPRPRHRGPGRSADLARDAGLVSGQGGDAIFFQMPSALVLSGPTSAARRRLRGFPAAARRSSRGSAPRSAWSGAAEPPGPEGPSAPQRPRRLPHRSLDSAPALLGRRSDPWLADTARRPAASQASTRSPRPGRDPAVRVGISRRRQAGDLIYPAAQPNPSSSSACRSPACSSPKAGGTTTAVRAGALSRAAFPDRDPRSAVGRATSPPSLRAMVAGSA